MTGRAGVYPEVVFKALVDMCENGVGVLSRWKFMDRYVPLRVVPGC